VSLERELGGRATPWHAAVILVRNRDGSVLAVSQGDDMDDWNLPGGNRELGDRTPAATARRELLEETGLVARRLRPLASWDSGAGRVVAFEAEGVRGQLRSSDEGKAAWVAPDLVVAPTSSYHRHNKVLLGARQRRRGRRRKAA